MKIVIDLTALADNFSGIERYALNFAKEMFFLEETNNFILLFKEKIFPEFLSFKEKRNCELIVLKRSKKLWFNQVTLLRNLKKLNGDIYFFPAFPAPFFFRGSGIINTIHDLGCWDCPETMPLKMVLYFRIMYRNAVMHSKKILTDSEFSKTRLCKILKVKPENIVVIYNGVAPNFYKEYFLSWNKTKEKYNLPDKYMLCLSTLEPRKNLKLLLQAFIDLVDKDNCEYHLVLAGRRGWKMNGYLDDVPEKFKELVSFTGFIEDSDLPQVYAHAAVFIFPSLYEGFGIPPLEAMAVGCPVISSDAEAMLEILGDKAIYFKNNNLDNLKEVLLKWMSGEIAMKKPEELIEHSKKYSYAKSINGLLNKLCDENYGELL